MADRDVLRFQAQAAHDMWRGLCSAVAARSLLQVGHGVPPVPSNAGVALPKSSTPIGKSSALIGQSNAQIGKSRAPNGKSSAKATPTGKALNVANAKISGGTAVTKAAKANPATSYMNGVVQPGAAKMGMSPPWVLLGLPPPPAPAALVPGKAAGHMLMNVAVAVVPGKAPAPGMVRPQILAPHRRSLPLALPPPTNGEAPRESATSERPLKRRHTN
jgi:hypothetical protein